MNSKKIGFYRIYEVTAIAECDGSDESFRQDALLFVDERAQCDNYSLAFGVSLNDIKRNADLECIDAFETGESLKTVLLDGRGLDEYVL